jgi:hypothetical protein
MGNQYAHVWDCCFGLISLNYHKIFGAVVVQLVEALRYKPESSGVRFPMVSVDFFHWHNPGFDSAPNRNGG